MARRKGPDHRGPDAVAGLRQRLRERGLDSEDGAQLLEEFEAWPVADPREPDRTDDEESFGGTR